MAEHGSKAVGAQLANLALLDRFFDSGSPRNFTETTFGSVSASSVLSGADQGIQAIEWTNLPGDLASPLTDAINSASATFVATTAELNQKYPHLQRLHSDAGLHCLASVPLTDSHGEVIGAAGFGWSDEQNFGSIQTTDIAIAAQICSHALERARTFEREQENSERARGLALAISGLVAAQIQTDVFAAFRDSLPWLVAADGLLGVAVDREGALAVLVPFHDGSVPGHKSDSQSSEHAGNERSVIAPDASQQALDAEGMSAGGDQPLLLNPILIQVAQTGEPIFHDGLSNDPNISEIQGSERRGFCSSIALLPLDAGAGFKGVMVLLFTNSQQFSDKQRLDLISFAALSSSALERARRAELEHEIAVTLQASLLPSVPLQMGRVQLAGRYLPGSSYAVVGGDWYDVIRLADHRILFVVGDVVGHGILSAAAMGKLSSATRALALVSAEPAELLGYLDVIAAGDDAMRFASIALVLADLQTGVLTISLAGHPAPLLRWPDGEVLELDGARSVSLGGLPVTRTQQSVRFQGTIDLVLYTDGLTERRDQHPSERIETLVGALGEGPTTASLLSDFLVSRMAAGEQRDDVAVLCTQMRGGPPNFARSIPSSPNALALLRKDLRDWINLVGMTEMECEDLILAMGEAATNAVEHGNRSNASHNVLVTANLRNDQVDLVITDEGQWVLPQSSNGLRGRGLDLMKVLVDSVAIETSREGTVLTLMKTLH
jgi:anti-sigma regulatory factor (Ser/Thr protein kinase)